MDAAPDFGKAEAAVFLQEGNDLAVVGVQFKMLGKLLQSPSMLFIPAKITMDFALSRRPRLPMISALFQ